MTLSSAIKKGQGAHSFSTMTFHDFYMTKQDAQLSQRDRAARYIIVFAKSRKLELGDNILRTL